MSLAIAIPLGVFIAVLAAVVFSAIGVSGEISRQEEKDEVDFMFDAGIAIRSSSADAPLWCEISRLLHDREGFCNGCPEHGQCNRATMVYTHSPRRNCYPWICLKRGVPEMTLEEACRLIDPETDTQELDKIEYYHGFNGKAAAAAALREASQMVIDFVCGGDGKVTNGDFIRSMSDADICENFTQLLCQFIQKKQLPRCQSREHCFHCIEDWLQEENKVLVRPEDEWNF